MSATSIAPGPTQALRATLSIAADEAEAALMSGGPAREPVLALMEALLSYLDGLAALARLTAEDLPARHVASALDAYDALACLTTTAPEENNLCPRLS